MDREQTWDILRHLGIDKELPWLVCGNFNEIFYAHENVGGTLREEGRMERFCKVLKDYCLLDICFLGNWFTWERGVFWYKYKGMVR